MEKMETFEKTIISSMIAIVGVLMLVQVAQAAMPQPQYACPICGERFATYDALYQHFAAEHPAEPIEIIWE